MRRGNGIESGIELRIVSNDEERKLTMGEMPTFIVEN